MNPRRTTIRVLALASVLAGALYGCHRSSGESGGRAAKVRLTEVMAANSNFALTDAAGRAVFSDWVELHNPGRTAVSLDGLSLTDNLQRPGKFDFPRGTVVPPGGYLVVFLFSRERCELRCLENEMKCRQECAGDDPSCIDDCLSRQASCVEGCAPPSGLVADINLSANADTLYLFGDNGSKILDRLGVKNQPADLASGIDPVTGKYGVIYVPTPGAPNRPTGLKLHRFGRPPAVRANTCGTELEVELTILRDVRAEGDLTVRVDWAEVPSCADGLSGLTLSQATVVRQSPSGGDPVTVDNDRFDLEGNPTTAEVVESTYIASLPPSECGTKLAYRVTASDSVGTLTREGCIDVGRQKATVVVNEYQPRNTFFHFRYTDPDSQKVHEKTPDWIEIYNYGAEPVDMTSLALLTPKNVQEGKFDFWLFGRDAKVTTLGPGQYLWVLADNDGDDPRRVYRRIDEGADPSSEYFSTRFALDASHKGPPNGKPFDEFLLVDSVSHEELDRVVLDFSQYGYDIKEAQSAARFPEAEGNRPNALMPGTITDFPTPGEPNSKEGDIAPTFKTGVAIESEGSARCPGEGKPVVIHAQFNADRDRSGADIKVSIGVTIDPPAEVEIADPEVTVAADQSGAAAGATLFDIRATIPGLPAGTLVLFDFKVEDRVLGAEVRHHEAGPQGEQVSFRYLVGYVPPEDGPRINEVMPGANDLTSLPDPYRGVKNDYAEIYNPGAGELDLGGYYLTTTPLPDLGAADPLIERARRFRFPDGTVVPPGGFLPVFFGPAPDGAEIPGYLEVKGFNLSCQDGEILYLIAPDARELGANCVVDSMRWRLEEILPNEDRVCRANTAVGRLCDGCTDAKCVVELNALTPGVSNATAVRPLLPADAFSEVLLPSPGPRNGCLPADASLLQLTAVFFIDENLRKAFGDQGKSLTAASFFVDRGDGSAEAELKVQRLNSGFPVCPPAGVHSNCASPPPGYVNAAVTVNLSAPFGPILRYRVVVTDACGSSLELGPYATASASAPHPAIAINEINVFFKVPGDPVGLDRPWIELYNAGASTADLSGMYLSDVDVQPRKARLPAGTTLASGAALLVLTDGEPFASHVQVDLTWARRNQGTLYLTDSDERGACLLEALPFDLDEVLPGESLGKTPDGTGSLVKLGAPSPGETNSDTRDHFLRGDANEDGRVNVTDMVRILAILFSGDSRRPHCEDALDADDSGVINNSDVVFLGNFLFRFGPVIPAPFPRRGLDTTPDQISPCSD